MIMRNSVRSCFVTCLPDLSNKKGRDDDTYCVVEESDPCGRYVRYKEILGKGAFKTVYRAFDEVEGIEVAWNQIKVHDALHTAEDLERLYSEVHLLKSLKHKNIIKLYHSWLDTTAKNLNFITEIFTSGTLRQYRKRHKQVDIKAVKSWCRQILRGLLYLHSHDPPIIHRDLKCDNIFVNGNQGEVKIGDLGLAAILPRTHAAHSVIGTPEFMAPEVYEEEYTELIDVYAFGMCLLEMVTSEYPYSECTNAAQIYKKVTLGKKPAALNKVNDPELREFVEKCLATVSRRLSVRELLRDPFLYCDGGCKATDCLPPVGSSIATADHIGELGDLLGNVLCRPSSVNRGLSNFESCPKLPQIHQAPMLIREPYLDPKTIHERSFATSPVKGLPSSHLKEGNPVRNVDLKVKGKRRDNGTLYLRLRIADTEDQIRVIHFPFDVEADTAMCVATEMVAELDLANQDVTRIADLIDAAIVFMVPGWRPGVAIDEACSEVDHHLCETPIYSEYPNLDEATVPSESSSLDHSRHDPMPWGCSSVKGVDLPSQKEGMVHGRFEELTYHHRVPEPLSRQGEEQCTDSSELSEESCDWEAVDESSSSVSPSAGSDTIFTSSPKRECKRNTEFKSNDIGEVLNLSEVDHCGVHTDNINRNYEDTEGIFSALESAAEIHEEDDKSAVASEELKELARKYELELRELQRKHEEDLLQLRNRWQQKRGLSYSLPKMQQCDTAPTKHLRRSESEKQLTNKHS